MSVSSSSSNSITDFEYMLVDEMLARKGEKGKSSFIVVIDEDTENVAQAIGQSLKGYRRGDRIELDLRAQILTLLTLRKILDWMKAKRLNINSISIDRVNTLDASEEDILGIAVRLLNTVKDRIDITTGKEREMKFNNTLELLYRENLEYYGKRIFFKASIIRVRP